LVEDARVLQGVIGVLARIDLERMLRFRGVCLLQDIEDRGLGA
jgi:hypothetical protein